MSSPRQHFRIRGWGRIGRGAGGFTLAEALLVLLNLGLAAVLLFAGLGWIRHHQRGEQFVADLQEYSTAFMAYRAKHHAWPPATTGETALPRALLDTLVEKNWDSGSPFGGSYGWDGRGGVVVTAFSPSFPLTVTPDELREIDRRLDDGNLATGRFRTGFNGWPIYQVEEKP